MSTSSLCLTNSAHGLTPGSPYNRAVTGGDPTELSSPRHWVRDDARMQEAQHLQFASASHSLLVRYVPAKGIFSFVAFVPDAELRAGSGEKTYVDAKWDEAGSVTALRTMYKVRLIDHQASPYV